jgi:hypothetical protein
LQHNINSSSRLQQAWLALLLAACLPHWLLLLSTHNLSCCRSSSSSSQLLLTCQVRQSQQLLLLLLLPLLLLGGPTLPGSLWSGRRSRTCWAWHQGQWQQQQASRQPKRVWQRQRQAL